ncbi:hypothetical protein EDI_324710 [Entamoeba dispar SAW760]|uniref:Uncharacterized protein n=1 Tax=Entamoeba dispar (strain ATCC PRA-260 / SAW760) TaxID=370354 RepID=B0EEZ6_ENTDS|nr:uncharacterized protein EDI_324710 [Entamoeba dispar SAW760]EDR26900.1 hypothetical protein EDI_324710 [Entamoeba dispar SAW760]|eukprot:EDR26900.1 hypothetical protein EDI_324710 [Entamoeba dispar SAW760]
MNSSTYIKNALGDLTKELSVVINHLLSTNLSAEGKSLVYAIASWTRQVSFIKEFNYDDTLFSYLDYLIADAQVLVLENEKLLEILCQFRFLYNKEYAIRFK